MTDIYGRSWPDISPNELCGECGQPDSCGDCNHAPLTLEQVQMLGGKAAE